MRSEQRVHHASPGTGTAQGRSLGDVSHDGEGAGWTAADQHAPIHGGELLRLIDDDMPVGPFTVGSRALGGKFRIHAVDVVDQHLRSDDARPDAGLGERVLGELLFFGAFGVQCLLPGHGLGVWAEQFHGFIEQRHVADREGRSLGAGQRPDVAFLEPWCEAPQLIGLGE